MSTHGAALLARGPLEAVCPTARVGCMAFVRMIVKRVCIHDADRRMLPVRRIALALALALAIIWLSGCTTVCSDVGGFATDSRFVENRRAFQAWVAEELMLISEGASIAKIPADYAVMPPHAQTSARTFRKSPASRARAGNRKTPRNRDLSRGRYCA